MTGTQFQVSIPGIGTKESGNGCIDENLIYVRLESSLGER